MIDLANEQCFQSISGVISLLKSTNQHEEVLSLIVDRVVRLYHCQSCAVVLIDPKTEYLQIENSHGLSLTFCNEFRRRIATHALGELLWTGKPLLISEAAGEATLASDVRLEHNFASCACLQIAVSQKTLGYFHLDSTEPGAFSERDLPVLQLFADIAGLALVKSYMYQENLRLERIDKETGLEKYIPYLEKLRRALARAEEFNEGLAVLLLDVDNFKDTVNTYGVGASRELLRELGSVAQSHLRPVDAIGRYGFDELVLLLVKSSREEALSAAEKLLTDIAGKSFTSQGIHSTVSVGVAAFPMDGKSAEDLLTTAKRALFEAQRRGRNMVCFFDPELHAREAR